MNNNLIKGTAYEKFTKTILLENNQLVYLWNDIPLDIFIKSNIFKSFKDKLLLQRNAKDHLKETLGIIDTGCDILYFNLQRNEWVIVQCKNYEKTIPQSKFAGYFHLLLRTKLYGEVYYTSTISRHIMMYESDNMNFIYLLLVKVYH
jgi:hypothetical protein